MDIIISESQMVLGVKARFQRALKELKGVYYIYYRPK
jgi:hypothetical protein